MGGWGSVGVGEDQVLTVHQVASKQDPKTSKPRDTTKHLYRPPSPTVSKIMIAGIYKINGSGCHGYLEKNSRQRRFFRVFIFSIYFWFCFVVFGWFCLFVFMRILKTERRKEEGSQERGSRPRLLARACEPECTPGSPSYAGASTKT